MSNGQVITELFEQIVHSEERIKQRFEDLKKVNQEIQNHQAKIKSIKYQKDSLLGKLNNMRHKLLEEQLEEKWMNIRKDILFTQKEKCFNEKHELVFELEEIQDRQKADSANFLEACDCFLEDFDVLSGSGIIEKKQNILQQRLSNLKIEEDSLKNDILECEKLEGRRNELKDDHEKLKQEIEELMKNKDECKNKLLSTQRDCKKMKDVKEGLLRKLQDNTNHRSLQNELDRSKKKLQYLTDEKHNLERQLADQQRERSNNNIETRPSNPWYISRPNTTPGFSHLNHTTVSSASSSSSTRRFQYSVNKGTSRKRPANDDVFSDLTSMSRDSSQNSQHSQNNRNDRNSFDFDIDLSDDDMLMSSYLLQEK